MSRPPLVSILIPAYNVQDVVADAIASAVTQTWPRKEIIVVDDGSRDATLSMARRFASREVRVVTQPNQGAAAARNHALSLCQGDYVQWLDADDLLAADKIARQLDVVERGADDRTLLSCAWGRFMHRPTRSSFVPTPLWTDLSPVEWLTRKLALNVYMQTATWLVTRTLTTKAGPWDTRLLSDDDGEYFCRVLRASTGIRFVPDARIFYRVPGPGGLSYIGRSNRKMDALWLSMELHVGYLLSLEDSPRTRAACAAYLETGLPNFHPERPDLVANARTLAATLGRRLGPPRVSPTYARLERWCGTACARGVQMVARRSRFRLRRSWDRVLCEVEAATHRARRPTTATPHLG